MKSPLLGVSGGGENGSIANTKFLLEKLCRMSDQRLTSGVLPKEVMCSVQAPLVIRSLAMSSMPYRQAMSRGLLVISKLGLSYNPHDLLEASPFQLISPRPVIEKELHDFVRPAYDCSLSLRYPTSFPREEWYLHEGPVYPSHPHRLDILVEQQPDF